MSEIIPVYIKSDGPYTCHAGRCCGGGGVRSSLGLHQVQPLGPDRAVAVGLMKIRTESRTNALPGIQ